MAGLPLCATLQTTVSTPAQETDKRPCAIVRTDGEEDDKASMVSFPLPSNDFKVEAIVNTSPEFHRVRGKILS